MVSRPRPRYFVENGNTRITRAALQWFPDLKFFREPFEILHALDKKERTQAYKYPAHQHFKEKELGELWNQVYNVVEIGNTQCSRHLMRHDPRDKGRQKDVIHNTSDKEHFYTEDGTGDRRTEHRGKAGTDAAYYKLLSVVTVKPEEAGKGRGQAPAYLRAWTLLPGGTTGCQGHNSCKKFYRYHSGLDLCPALMDSLDHLLGPVPLSFRSNVFRYKGTRKERNRYKKKKKGELAHLRSADIEDMDKYSC
jgi:hypothetical protein